MMKGKFRKIGLAFIPAALAFVVGLPQAARAEVLSFDFKQVWSVHVDTTSGAVDSVQIQGKRGDGYEPGVTDYLVEFRINSKNKEGILNCLELAQTAANLQRVGKGANLRIQADGRKSRNGTTLGLVGATPQFCTLFVAG